MRCICAFQENSCISQTIIFRLLFPRTAVTAAVVMIQMRHLVKNKLRLILHNPKLTDSVIHMNLRIPHGVYRHEPLVVIAAVRTVYHALVIRLNNAEILKC